MLEERTDGVRTEASLYREASNGAIELWLIYSPQEDKALALVATMENEDGRGRKSGMIVDGAGYDRSRWVSLVVDEIRELFRTRGYHKFQIFGRKGWARDLPTFKIRSVLYEEMI